MPFAENINKAGTVKRVLVAPLDWGLGHATRCIPIINSCINSGIQVVVAGESESLAILEKLHPSLVILRLKGYRVSYSKNRSFFLSKMLLQLPGIMLAISREKKWLAKTIKEQKIDAVISDNRFGLHNRSIPSVFITHQLNIKTGNSLTEKIAQKINYYFINKFDECWIPDNEKYPGLAGELSHPQKSPGVPVKYLGCLSRFRKKDITEKNNDLLILLSGPEPQRSIFENILLKQLNRFNGSVTLVRGLPGTSKSLTVEHPGITIFNHLETGALNDLILRSEQIVARSGYSTVMDLYTLGKTAVLVPTPGQTEQEYLAKHLRKQKLFYSCEQENFSLADSLGQLKKFEAQEMRNDEKNTLEPVISNWLRSI